mgnify:CR=1 FL=1
MKILHVMRPCYLLCLVFVFSALVFIVECLVFVFIFVFIFVFVFGRAHVLIHAWWIFSTCRAI